MCAWAGLQDDASSPQPSPPEEEREFRRATVNRQDALICRVADSLANDYVGAESGGMVQPQILPDTLVLVMELTKCQADDNDCQAKDNREVHYWRKQSDAEKRQIKDQQNARQTNNGLQIRIKTLSILRVGIKQLLVCGLPDR